MRTVFSINDPARVVQEYIKTLPAGQRRGVRQRLAKSAGIFPSYLSQIFKGSRTFNTDQALGIAEFISLNDTETRYFLLLVERERAQSQRLRDRLTLEIENLRASEASLTKALDHIQIEMTQADHQRFYSSWQYLAVRLLIAIPEYSTLYQVAAKLGISPDSLQNITRFLVRTQLCTLTNQKYGVGPTHTHLPSDSPFIAQHHSNWRRRAMDRHPFLNPAKELAYSGGVTLSKEDAYKIQQMCLEFIKSVRLISDPSRPEALYCLNLDWFEV